MECVCEWLRESVVESDGGERMMEEGKGGRERRGRERREREWWAVGEGGGNGGQ